LCPVGVERGGVRAWSGELQVDQLEECFQVAWRGGSRNSLVHLPYIRTDSRQLAGESFAKIVGAEPPEAAGLNDGGGGERGDVVLIRDERGATRTSARDEHLVLAEVGGLQQHRHAVLQLPDQHTYLGDLPLRDDLTLLRLLRDERSLRDRIAVRGDTLPRDQLHDGGEQLVVRDRRLGLVRSAHEDDAVRNARP